MVARAREGKFTAEDARTSPKAMMQRHFEPQPDGGWAAKPELKRMVRFENGDLLRMAVPTARYDVVFCRNTVIYFTEEVRDALHERLVKALSPGGYLVVGTSERVADPRGLGLTLAPPLHLPEELMDEYLPMFLAEGREHLQELNLAVVSIEESPDDPATVDEIFRIAHSLKGMSATMGFAGMAALTHEMEDVFELLRQRSGGLERVAIDVLFQCLDALSAAVESIDNDRRRGDRAAASLIESLRGLVRDRTPEQEAERLGVAPAPLTTSPRWPTGAA